MTELKTTETKKIAPKEKERTALDTAKDLFGQLRDADESAIHKRQRYQLLPWGVGAVTAVSALLALRVNATTGADIRTSLVVGGLADAAIVAGLYLPRALKVGFLAEVARWARAHRGNTLTAALAAWAWFTAGVILGLDAIPALLTTGLAALYLVSAGWWQAHRISYPSAPVVPQAPTLDEMIIEEQQIETDKILDKWTAKVGNNNGGSLPGAVIRNRTEVKAGYSYELHLVGGKQTLADALSAIPRIATAIGVPARNILIEDVQPTGEDQEPDPAILRFQVITNSPIKKSVQLNPDGWHENKTDLWIDLGPFADGEGFAPWRVFTENSIWGGYVVGDTGAGKSCTLEGLAIKMMRTRRVVIFYLDPVKDGASSVGLFKHARWSIGNDPERIDRMLTGIETLVDIRFAENMVELDTAGFTATPERPGIILIVDEAHKVNEIYGERMAELARKGRAAGFAIIDASQIYGLESFGGLDALRQSLTGANTVAHRVGRNQASIMHGMPISPADLPNIPGYGVVLATDPAYNRTAPFRSEYTGEKERMAMLAEAATFMPEIDALGIAALDNLTENAYSNRHVETEQALSEKRELLRQLRAGGKVLLPHADPTGNDLGPAMPVLSDFMDEVENYVNAPSHGYVGVKKVIYEGLLNGTTTRAGLLDYAQSVGFTSTSWFDDQLKELVTEGVAVKGAKAGDYELRESA